MFSFATIVLSMASLAAAAPRGGYEKHHTSTSTTSTAAPTPTYAPIVWTVNYCTDMNWAGTCQTDTFVNGACFSVIKSMNDKTSSFQALDPRAECILYKDSGCQGSRFEISGAEPITNLKDHGFNDQMSSYSCTATLS